MVRSDINKGNRWSSHPTPTIYLALMIALITGGGRGIGRAVALRLAKNGWGVAIASRSANELAETVDEAGGRMLSITADVASAEDVRVMVERTERELGAIDLLVNNAGVPGPTVPFWETDPQDWWRCQEVNVLGPMLCCRQVVPAWLPHSVRGFLSGTVRKKMGLTVTSTKGEDGERTYSVEA